MGCPYFSVSPQAVRAQAAAWVPFPTVDVPDHAHYTLGTVILLVGLTGMLGNLTVIYTFCRCPVGRVGAWALRAASQEEMGQNTGLKFWCQLCQGTVEPSLQSQERSPKVVQSNLSGISDWAPGAPPTPCVGPTHISACSLCPRFTSTITCPGGHFPLTQRAALV